MMKWGDSMTKDETLRVLAILKAAYPASYNGMTKREANGTVAVWCMQFADVPVDIVLMAVQKLISTSKFPPAISEVKSKIGSIHYEAHECLCYGLGGSLTDDMRQKYQRIYDATRDFKISKMAEPSLYQMIEGGNALQIGSGEN